MLKWSKGVKTMVNAREISLKILLEFEKEEAYSNILLNSKLKNIDVSDTDKALITKLVYGVITYKKTLDYIISNLSKIKLKKISESILNILRLGLYQIYYLDKVPNSAACNEAVKLAKKYGHQSSANFVNAILRNASRKKKEEFFENIENINDKLALYYSYPNWIIDLYIKQYGVDRTINILKENENVLTDCIRVNTLKITKEELLNKLNLEGYSIREGRVKDILYTEELKKLLSSEYFKNGLFTVQDEAPSLVAHIINPKPGEKILDICAAPGGKTTHLAQLSDDRADITAFEIHEHRCKLIEDLCRRLDINLVNVQQKDATIFDEKYVEKFDKIVADVPCSGLGVIRKKPDIKWNTKEEDINNLIKIQLEILNNAGKYLKNNGVLVYSTCTNNQEENEQIVDKFLTENKNFEIAEINNIPEEFAEYIANKGMLTLLPDINNCDGFFICKLTKTNN